MIQVRLTGYIIMILTLSLLLVLSSAGCSEDTPLEEPDPAKEILNSAALHIEKGNYEQAAMIYTAFLENNTDHPYVDDAAYRLAYLRVIADQANPYLNYQQAGLFFENFIETYPNSRYINACTNWLHVLNKINPARAEPVIVSVKENVKPAAKKQLQEQLYLLENENMRLKQKLRELQDAIER